MLFKEGGDFIVECDECGNDEDLWTNDFQQAVRAIKEMGWRAECTDGEWEHYCYKCKDVDEPLEPTYIP